MAENSNSFSIILAAQPTVGTNVERSKQVLVLRGKQSVVSAVIGGKFSAGSTIIFEYSTDGGINWVALPMAASGAYPATSYIGGSPLVLTGYAPFLAVVRARCTVYAAGDLIDVSLSGSELVPGTVPFAIAAPGGAQTSPSVPASTTPLTSPFGFDSMVYIAGGTVTVIALGGVATGLTSGSFRVPAGQSITLTYSVAPTWKWFAG